MQLFGLTARDVGRPFQDLEVSYRPVELRAHIEEAASERRAIWVRDVEQVRSGETVSLDIQVVPLVGRDRRGPRASRSSSTTSPSTGSCRTS